MLAELQTYYRNEGILSTSFTCRYQHLCSKDCSTFTGPKSAFVSTGYEFRKLPRLLFLSLDSGSGDQSARNRLPESVRQQEEVDQSVAALPKHKHWYRTHELAWYILKSFDSNLQLEDTKKYFAHANSAKCCMNNPQRKKASAVLFRNCQRYLRGELAILKPDIIVTQGNEAKSAICTMKDQTVQSLDEFASVISFIGKKTFWLHTYHPANWGAFNKQRNQNKATREAEGWLKYAKHISDFVTEQA